MSTRNSIRVEYYHATDEDVESLLDYLSVSDAIESIDHGAARKASGLVEVGTAFYVVLKPILETYAATKLLDIVYDEIARWFKKKKKGKKGQFITVSKWSGKQKKIGSGRPKRYR